jgi:hypothetical protein
MASYNVAQNVAEYSQTFRIKATMLHYLGNIAKAIYSLRPGLVVSICSDVQAAERYWREWDPDSAGSCQSPD